MDLSQILLKPVVTEKSTREEAKGKYTFLVNDHATKIDIQNAIKMLYGVKVEKVSVRQVLEKTRLVGRGRVLTKRSAGKKITITLEKGKTLDPYKFKK
ncbi:MAG: 50S ribosomal protein L23 [Candidatus Gracilibacteria bacterium]|jgi:large subunit ribosomal protein L23